MRCRQRCQGVSGASATAAASACLEQAQQLLKPLPLQWLLLPPVEGPAVVNRRDWAQPPKGAGVQLVLHLERTGRP